MKLYTKRKDEYVHLKTHVACHPNSITVPHKGLTTTWNWTSTQRYCISVLLQNNFTGPHRGLNRTSAGYPFVAIVLLYYWLLLHTSAPTCAAWALRDYCVSSAWGRPPICWGDTHDFEIVLLWFNSLIRFYYGFPKLYNGYHDDVWLRLLLISISFVKLNTMGIKELMIVTASLDK